MARPSLLAFAVNAPVRGCSFLASCTCQGVIPASVKRRGRRRHASLVATATPPASFSSPLPLYDPFFHSKLVFLQYEFSSSARPELLGTVLWAVGLYLGLSEKKRLGEYLRTAMQETFGQFLSKDIAESAATALHTLPFLFAGFAIDSVLRVALGGNGGWADASGLTLALYGGVYEAGRSSAKVKKVDEAEERQFNAFVDFAQRRLERRGRCHLYDVRNALVQDSKARGRVGRISDEQLRRFIRTYAPSAIRSPNGFYRELSVVEKKEPVSF